jgi:hypothetical protein
MADKAKKTAKPKWTPPWAKKGTDMKKMASGGSSHSAKRDKKFAPTAQVAPGVRAVQATPSSPTTAPNPGTPVRTAPTAQVAPVVSAAQVKPSSLTTSPVRPTSPVMPQNYKKKGGAVKSDRKQDKKMASGGSFRSSANGIAKKGKTKGKQVKMAGGGMAKGCK